MDLKLEKNIKKEFFSLKYNFVFFYGLWYIKKYIYIIFINIIYIIYIY